MRKEIIIWFCMFLLIGTVIAYNPEYYGLLLTNQQFFDLTEEQINNTLNDFSNEGFSWTNKGLEFRGMINTVEKYNSSHYQIIDRTLKATLSYDTIIYCLDQTSWDSTGVNTCVDLLIYYPENFEYETTVYTPMYAQILEQIELEKIKVKELQEQETYNQIQQLFGGLIG